jgi:hypothetical protein
MLPISEADKTTQAEVRLFRSLAASRLDLVLQMAGASIIGAGAKADLCANFPSGDFVAACNRDHALEWAEREAKRVLDALAAYKLSLAMPDNECAAAQRQQTAERLGAVAALGNYKGTGDTYPDASPPPLPAAEPGTLDGDRFGEARPGELS